MNSECVTDEVNIRINREGARTAATCSYKLAPRALWVKNKTQLIVLES